MAELSIIVACYNMRQQIGNTLLSILPPYQVEVTNEQLEIQLVDNGSIHKLPVEVWAKAGNVGYTYVAPSQAKASPAHAINEGVTRTSAPFLCLMIDGARMLTPGVLKWGLQLLRLAPRFLVEVRGWHLGPKWQPESVREGYDHDAEAKLLEQTNWKENGYRLFDICADTPQTKAGLSVPAAESNCLFLSRELFDELGGFNEGYTAPGGGLVNLDFYARAVAAADRVWTLLGEGTFHQVHGGAATGLSAAELQEAFQSWKAESEKLRGPLPALDARKFVLAGHIPPEFERWLARRQPVTR